MAILGQFRGDLRSEWEKVNPVIHEREFILVKETADGPWTGYKIGDGVKKFNELEYASNVTILQVLGNSETATISQKAITDELEKARESFLPDKSFSGMVGVAYGKLCNLTSGGAFTEYLDNPAYDTAWVQVFDGSTALEISGATVVRTNFFSTPIPSVEGYLGNVTGLTPAVKEGAILACITMAVTSNTGGYKNLRVKQSGMGATKAELEKTVADKTWVLVGDLFTNKGAWISLSDGQIRANDAYSYTPYLPITGKDDIIVTGGYNTTGTSGGTVTPIAFYDKNRKYISGYSGANTPRVFTVKKEDIPMGARFIRSCRNDNITTPQESSIVGYDLSALAYMPYSDLFFDEDEAGFSTRGARLISLMFGQFTVNGYITKTSGSVSVSSSDDLICTDFIKLNRECDVVMCGYESTTASKLSYYDRNKVWISNEEDVTVATKFESIRIPKENFPENAEYIRCTATKKQTNPFVFNTSIGLLDKTLEKLDSENTQFINDHYRQVTIGKNLLNPNDFLYGWTYSSDNGFEESPDGIMSNKLYLSPGTYAFQGASPWSAFNRNRLVVFNDKDEVVGTVQINLDTDWKGTFNVTATGKFDKMTYARLVMQYTKIVPLDITKIQLEKGSACTAVEAPIVEYIHNKTDDMSDSIAFLTGASNAMSGNGWFEYACRMLNIKPRNVAVSGQSVMQAADLAWRGQLYTDEELENMEYFVTSHTHNYNVCYENPLSTILCDTVEQYEAKGYDASNNEISNPDKTNTNHHIVPQGGGFGSEGPASENDAARAANERYTAGYDYLLKKYIQDCYNLRNKVGSKWYGTKTGKPVRIIICSYWHDGYKTFNESSEKLARKFGAAYCNIADNVGFSYRQTNPFVESSIRQSFLYCNNAAFSSGNDSEDIPIDGVLYTGMGWHATRDLVAPLTIKRGTSLAFTMLYGNPTTTIREDVKDVKRELRNVISDVLITMPKGKNYLNPKDTMLGYGTNNGQWYQQDNNILSNKLFLTAGTFYTISGVNSFNNAYNYILHFDKDDNYIGRTALAKPESNITTFEFAPIANSAYVRLALKGNANATYNAETAQLEEGKSATAFEPHLGYRYYLGNRIYNPNSKKGVLLTGASFAYSRNQWFGMVCEKLGITGFNKAESSLTIASSTAQRMHDGTLYSEEEFEQFDVFLIFHSHNEKVSNTENLKADYTEYTFPITDKSVAWDYVLKKYAADCYAAKDNPNSRWYGTKYGKPFIVAACTNWHDSRTVFDDSIRELRDKWGFHLIELDKKIGFSKNQVHPITGEQVSVLYSVDTQVIDGVTYGWHPTREANAYAQIRIAQIVSEELSKLLE